MKDTNARVTRWYLALQPFNFKVIHRPGAQMVVADFLSCPGGGGGGVIGRMAPRPKSGGGGMWWGCGFDVGCRREWTRGSREIVRTAENQVISGNCLIGRLL